VLEKIVTFGVLHGSELGGPPFGMLAVPENRGPTHTWPIMRPIIQFSADSSRQTERRSLRTGRL